MNKEDLELLLKILKENFSKDWFSPLIINANTVIKIKELIYKEDKNE